MYLIHRLLAQRGPPRAGAAAVRMAPAASNTVSIDHMFIYYILCIICCMLCIIYHVIICYVNL